MSLRTCLILAAALTAACSGAPANIEYVETTPTSPRINEIATVRFKLSDYRGVPQAGSLVTFRIVGGNDSVTITPLAAMSLKGSGEVATQVTATAGVTSVIIEANAGSGKIATSPPISFAGTNVPNSAQFTFQCGEIAGMSSGGVHAIGAYDPERHLIAGVKLNCSAHTADRNGDGVPGASVSFLTEAGTIGPSETTKTDVIGDATILYKTSLPFPKEVPPRTFQWNPDTTCEATGDRRELRCSGELLVPLWMEPQVWTTNPLGTLLNGVPAYNASNLQEPRRRDPIRRTAAGQQPENNPRDNLVTLIAITNGEEGFIDVNGDGQYDQGTEPFIDTVEPFVDSNDNGTCDIDEKFIDTNGDGAWSGMNERWDANTIIWRQDRILWTGIPYYATYGGGPTMNQLDDNSPPEPVVRGGQVSGTGLITCGGSIGVNLILADPWWNTLAQNGSGDGCKKRSSSKNVDVDAEAFFGLAFTYPPIRRYSYGIVDNLERLPMPMTCPASPGCFPPPYSPPAHNCPTNIGPTGSNVQPWSASVACEFTASPEEGHKVIIGDTVSGTIINNLPNSL